MANLLHSAIYQINARSIIQAIFLFMNSYKKRARSFVISFFPFIFLLEKFTGRFDAVAANNTVT